MRILAVVTLLLGLVGITTAQNFCGGAGYDVSAAATKDLSLVSGGYTWWLHPCGAVSAASNVNCTTHAIGPAMLCQSYSTGAYIASVYNQSLASSTQWLALLNGKGVQMSIQDGDGCGIGAPRETTVQFICNTTATTPWFASVTEVETCWYTAVVHTSSACTPTGSTGSHSVGSSFYDSVCGGHTYDLSAIHNYGDMRFDTNTSTPTNGYFYYLNLCGTVQNGNCSGLQPTSFCQTNKPTGGVASLAYTNDTTMAVYTVNPDGVTLAIQDGTPCGGIPFRQASIQVICDGTSPPQLVSVRESETCHYSAVVRGVCSLLSSSTGGSGTSSSGATGTSSPAVSSSGTPQPPSGNAAHSQASGFTLAVLISALALMLIPLASALSE